MRNKSQKILPSLMYLCQRRRAQLNQNPQPAAQVRLKVTKNMKTMNLETCTMQSFFRCFPSTYSSDLCLTMESFCQDVISFIRTDATDLLEVILSQGLDPNSRYNDTSFEYGERDDTLLHWAARFDSPECARVRPTASLSFCHCLFAATIISA